MTKAIGEKLIVYANLLHSETKFVTVRGGNAWHERQCCASVQKSDSPKRSGIHYRYGHDPIFPYAQDAITLLFKASVESVGGEIFVMTMPTCKIVDLAEVLIEDSGVENVAIVERGVRPGEKIHEILMSEFESMTTVVYDEQYLVILPTLGIRDYGSITQLPTGALQQF